MDSISLSQTMLNNLEVLSLKSNITSTEASLYLYDGSVIKIYDTDSILYLSNKKYVVNTLYNYKDELLNNFCIPLKNIYIDNEFKGILMPYISGFNLSTMLNHKNISLRSKLKYLKEIGSLLENIDYLRHKESVSLYLNDIHEDNFIIDKYGKIHVIDLDSVKIDNEKNVAPSKYLSSSSLASKTNGNKYIFDYYYSFEVNKNTDLYCYNIMILNFLCGIYINNISILDYLNILDYMSRINIDKDLIDSFERVISSSDNINPYYMLDNISSEKLKSLRKYVKKNIPVSSNN